MGLEQKASFGQRLVAAIIDALIIGVPFGILNAAVTSASASALISLIQLGVGIWYFGTFEGTKTQTLGKQAMNIRVVDIRTGQPIGNARGVGRYFARFLSAIACLIGFFWMLWDPERQTWHDKLTDSHVVRG